MLVISPMRKSSLVNNILVNLTVIKNKKHRNFRFIKEQKSVHVKANEICCINICVIIFVNKSFLAY